MSNIPVELKYTKSHEWVRVNDDGSVTVGISDSAQDQLGDMVFIEVPEIGQSVTAEEACAVVESVKATADSTRSLWPMPKARPAARSARPRRARSCG